MILACRSQLQATELNAVLPIALHETIRCCQQIEHWRMIPSFCYGQFCSSMAPYHDCPHSKEDDSCSEASSRKISLEDQTFSVTQIPWIGCPDKSLVEAGPVHEHPKSWTSIRRWVQRDGSYLNEYLRECYRKQVISRWPVTVHVQCVYARCLKSLPTIVILFVRRVHV